MLDHAILQKIENNQKITYSADYEFLYEYQKSILLALKESGTLTVTQYRNAEQILKTQRLEYRKKNVTGGDTNNQSSQLLPCIYR